MGVELVNRGSVELSPGDGGLPVWHGCVEWIAEERWWRPWRLPAGRVATAHAPMLASRARMPAGVRAALVTDADGLSMEFDGVDETTSPVDVMVDDKLWARRAPTTGEVRIDLPAGVKTVEVWLPQFGEIRLGRFTLANASRLEAGLVDRPRWITYGSSITHCREAAGPSETWPALAARRYGWDLTCLGFGGQCHLDSVVARTIAATPADVISLCVGINVYGAASFGARAWPSQVGGFIEAVRAAHPDVSIVVLSPNFTPHREDTPNQVGMTLSEVRQGVADAVAVLQQLGEKNLHYVDGRTIIRDGEDHLRANDVHPNAAGYHTMAERLGPILHDAMAG